MKAIQYLTAFALSAAAVIALSYAPQLRANDKVEYCKNAKTGEIIVVKKNMPCPFPMHKI